MSEKNEATFGSDVKRLPIKDLAKRIGPGLIATGIVIGPGAVTTSAMLALSPPPPCWAPVTATP